MTDSKPDLALIILLDLMQHKFVLLLAFLCLGSAMCVTFVAHGARERNARLESLLEARDGLEIEWRHLVLEENALVEHNHIERMASKKLGMRYPQPADERVLTLP